MGEKQFLPPKRKEDSFLQENNVSSNFIITKRIIAVNVCSTVSPQAMNPQLANFQRFK